MKIRIIVPLVELGSVQLLQGHQLDAPEEVALELVKKMEAQLVPIAEQAIAPRTAETAVMPRPQVSKPKPSAKPKGK